MNTHPSPFPAYEPLPPQGRQLEPPDLKYARQSRNAVVFLAWVVGVIAVVSLVYGVILGIQVNRLSVELNNTNTAPAVTSNCVPGSAIPGC